MTNHTSLFLFLSTILFFHHITVQSQSPSPSPAPTPSPAHHEPPPNIIKILKKSGQFKTFVRLLKTTQLDTNLNSQLGHPNNGLTIFAPADNAFSGEKKHTFRSLKHQQVVELVQFHIVPAFISTFQFDTVTNPLKTHAGSGPRFQLNVTTSGDTVHIFTGLTNTTVDGVVYSDDHLAIYKVHMVLLPLDIFTPKPPPPPAATAVDTPEIGSDEDEEGDDEGDEEEDDGVKVKSGGVMGCNVGFDLVLFGLIGVISSMSRM